MKFLCLIEIDRYKTRIYAIGIRNKVYGEVIEAKKLMKITLKAVSTIPDKPLKTTFENGAVIPNLLQVMDSATP